MCFDHPLMNKRRYTNCKVPVHVQSAIGKDACKIHHPVRVKDVMDTIADGHLRYAKS
jgi:hypothetical protein